MTYKEIIYICLDLIKSLNGDNIITLEHVLFLANLFRALLIEEKKKNKGAHSLTSANELTICIDLDTIESSNGLDYCGNLYLKSSLEIPTLMDEEVVTVNFADKWNIRTSFVSKERFKYVGYNKYLKNIIYCTIGDDKHLYINSLNPQFKYLKDSLAKVTGLFEDAKKASELSCDLLNTGDCDILELKFPIDADLTAQLIDMIVKTLSGFIYKPRDTENNAADDLADLATFVRRNMKSPIARQMTE